MTREEILDGIAKTDKVINNPIIPEAVKQVAINTKAKLQAQLDAMGGEAPKVEKVEIVEKVEVEKEVEKPAKKERVKFERKPRTPKAPKKEKEKETESPESKAEKSMEGKKLSVANCRELLAKLKTRREGAKKRVATRKKQGKPAQLTTIEVLKKASDNLEKKVETEVNKDGKLQKTTIKRSTKEVVDIVATIISGIPTKAERTEYINEVIADLKKLIDKVEPITEKMEKGGYMAKGGIFNKGPLEFKNSIQGSDGDYTYNLTFQPRTNLSSLYIEDNENGTSRIFPVIYYSVVEGFARQFQDLMDEHEDEFTETNWKFNYRVMSAHHDDTEYGASSKNGVFTIFIGDKTYTFESESLMQEIAESFIQLENLVGDKGYDDQNYAKGGELKDASNLTEQERFELKVLKALSGFNKGLNINSLYEVLGFSNYRFNQYATDEQVEQVENALSSLMNKGYVEDSAFGYGQTIQGRKYIDSFQYGSYEDGGMMAKGGKITRNKNKNDWKGKFDFFVDNNYQPIGKRDLINMAYESSNGIDSAIPQSMYGEVDNTAYYVYDYQTDKMGELVDLREKLKFSNVKVDVTIVQDDKLKYGNDLPSELQDVTFHQALNYVFNNDSIEQFAIRPKK